LIVVLSLVKAPGSAAFLTTAVAFGCVVVDVLLAVKFNMPINGQFHQYASGGQGVDWESLRKTWLQCIEYRGAVQVVGFLALLAGIQSMK
jgi:hypothetical protein